METNMYIKLSGYTFLHEHAVDLVMPKVMSIIDG